jgi:hypothetical protein
LYAYVTVAYETVGLATPADEFPQIAGLNVR